MDYDTGPPFYTLEVTYFNDDNPFNRNTTEGRIYAILTKLTNQCIQRDKALERRLLLEDNLELHFPAVYPKKDCVEFKVNEKFSYQSAIRASLRLLPTWILVSEIRSVEVTHLLEAVSTGTHCMSTIHAECVEMIPNRIKNMAADKNRDWEEEAFRHIDVGVYIRKEMKEKGEITRHIAQVCFFERKEEENVVTMIVDNGYVISENIPESKRKKFELYHVELPKLEREVFYG